MGPSLNPDTLVIVVTILIQTAGLVGAIWRMSLRYEHRITHLEANQENINRTLATLPRRQGDYHAPAN